MCGISRGEVGVPHLINDLRVAFLEKEDLEKAVDIAQNEWDSCLIYYYVSFWIKAKTILHLAHQNQIKQVSIPLWLRLESMAMQDRLVTYLFWIGNWWIILDNHIN